MSEDVQEWDIKIPKKRHTHYIQRAVHPSYNKDQENVQYVENRSYRRSTKNPKWRQQVKQGVNATTPLSAFRYRNNQKPYHLRCLYNYDGIEYTWMPLERFAYGTHYIAGLGAVTVPPEMEAKANNQALTSYISQANDARRMLNGGELVGEFAELVRQVSSPGKGLRNLLGGYVETVKKRTQSSRVRRLPRRRRADVQAGLIRDSWLEYAFGWSPLVSEIQSVYDYVKEEDPFARHETRKIHGVGKVEDSWWYTSTKSSILNYPLTIKARRRDKAKVIVIYRGQLRMRPSAAGYISEKVGLHPTDWIPTAWELVPYSFLVDYFLNIGDLIQAASFPTGSLAWTNKTVITEGVRSFVDQEVNWNAPTVSYCTVVPMSTELGGANYQTRNVERSKYIGSFIPDWEFSIPGSGTKWLNMAALFVGSRKVEQLLKQ